MSSRRPLVLTGILLLLVLAYSSRGLWFSKIDSGYGEHSPYPATLAGVNSVSGLRVHQAPNGAWVAQFNYFYTGQPRSAFLKYQLIPQTGSAADPSRGLLSGFHPAEPGAHSANFVIRHPGMETVTGQVAIELHGPAPGGPLVARQQVDQMINWPDMSTYAQLMLFGQSTPEQNFTRAVAFVDAGSEAELSEAKFILERLIEKNAQFDDAYVQLARVAMKANWGTEGLHQAERLIDSALQIRPDNVNAKILLGYVYTHQQHYPKAEALFVQAADAKAQNPWLWTNWGELLAAQGKDDQAMAKYRIAISAPMTHDSYDLAREQAYRLLLAQLERRKDLDGMEALHKQRVAAFGANTCYIAEYAWFLLAYRDDAKAAIDLTQPVQNQGCGGVTLRQVLGLAYYVKWAEMKGPERTAALNQARVYLPAGPAPLYLLATSARTAPAAKQLLLAGEQIDQRDNLMLTALAYAFEARNLPAAERLLAMGARWNALVGAADIPVAMMPVLSGDVDGVRMLLHHGVDYSSLRFRGVTAIDIARQSGNKAMLDVLSSRGASL